MLLAFGLKINSVILQKNQSLINHTINFGRFKMKTYFTVLTVCVVLLCPLVFSDQLLAQFDWEHNAQPVMDYGPTGEWDCCNLMFPFIIK